MNNNKLIFGIIFIIMAAIAGIYFAIGKTDTSQSDVSKVIDKFTVNDMNIQPYFGKGEVDFNQMQPGKGYMEINPDSVIRLSVNLPESFDERVTWLLDNNKIASGTNAIINPPQDDQLPHRITVHVVGYEEKKKLFKIKRRNPVVKNTLDDKESSIGEVESSNEIEIAVIKPADQPAKKVSNLKEETKEQKKVIVPASFQMPVKEIKKPQKEVKLIEPEAEKVYTPPPMEVKTIVKEVNHTYRLDKEGLEGALMTESCDDVIWVDATSIKFVPVQDAELLECYLHANKGGSVNFFLFENGKQIKGPVSKTVSNGKSQIRLALHTRLLSGNSYELKVKSKGDVRLADFKPCKAKVGGSLLQPAYGKSVALFNIKFIY